MSNTLDELLCMLIDKIENGQNLIKHLKPIEEVDGVKKLQRKIRQEVEFLKKLQLSQKVKIEQLSCSNLRHLGALVECALRPGVIAVLKTFHIDKENKLLVDVIHENGQVWTKVIARNPKSLSALSSGNASYGARSILDQAKDYLDCAKLYPCMYKPPKVIFEFASGIEENLAFKLKNVGVIIKGEILPDSKFIESDEDDEYDDDETQDDDDLQCQINRSQDLDQCIDEHGAIDKLNLDVTTMMAYVSNMTNGHSNYVFKQEVLTQQSAWDAERPVKPILERLFKDKTLVCCQTAWDDFSKIVDTLGGPSEKERTAQLRSIITMYPDDYGGQDDFPRQNLKVRGNVRLRSKKVFNFGHRIKAITVSANEGFVRAAMQQGVRYAAFIHESRALTEGKESTATFKES